MVFLGVYRAVYDYAPAGEGELAINEGDLLFVLEKSTEDDWWKAKKKSSSEDEDEPEGLIPNNYIEEVRSTIHWTANCRHAVEAAKRCSFICILHRASNDHEMGQSG